MTVKLYYVVWAKVTGTLAIAISELPGVQLILSFPTTVREKSTCRMPRSAPCPTA